MTSYDDEVVAFEGSSWRGAADKAEITQSTVDSQILYSSAANLSSVVV